LELQGCFCGTNVPKADYTLRQSCASAVHTLGVTHSTINTPRLLFSRFTSPSAERHVTIFARAVVRYRVQSLLCKFRALTPVSLDTRTLLAAESWMNWCERTHGLLPICRCCLRRRHRFRFGLPRYNTTRRLVVPEGCNSTIRRVGGFLRNIRLGAEYETPCSTHGRTSAGHHWS